MTADFFFSPGDKLKNFQHILMFYCLSQDITDLSESYSVMSLSCQVNHHKNMCEAPGGSYFLHLSILKGEILSLKISECYDTFLQKAEVSCLLFY